MKTKKEMWLAPDLKRAADIDLKTTTHQQQTDLQVSDQEHN